MWINCKRFKAIESCKCADGSTWDAPDDDNGGNGGCKRKGKGPCGCKENIGKCTCEDGKTYDNLKDLWINCKGFRAIESCKCADGSTWEPSNDGNGTGIGGGKPGGKGRGRGKGRKG